MTFGQRAQERAGQREGEREERQEIQERERRVREGERERGRHFPASAFVVRLLGIGARPDEARIALAEFPNGGREMSFKLGDTRSMVYMRHREMETRPHLRRRLLFSYSKILQK